MATWNKALHALKKDDVDRISLEYLMGWQDLMANGHGFRLQGFNHMREKYGLEPLTKDMSFDYRIEYVKSHYTEEEIRDTITEYMRTARVGDTRWTGIELFGCRFGREYARAFKILMGSHEYRKMAEELRNRKSIQTQTVLYGGIGLAGEATKLKAQQTNQQRHGGKNVMDDMSVRQTLAKTNQARYGGSSPFSDTAIRQKALTKKSSELVAAMQEYKKIGVVSDISCESTFEFSVFKKLVDRFGASDVFSQYGLHPYDARYPYNCDFYIKSLDLFIELHLHYSHGRHWFDVNNHDDVLRLKHLQSLGTSRGQKLGYKWSVSDLEKRDKAKSSGIRYLVFWGNRACDDPENIPDFNAWFFDYDCDYDTFVKDFPGNTY